MKARFFSLLAMVLCLASCQKDVDGLDVNVGGDTATISVVLPENAITRATETDSAASGLANETGEELTVTLYIFDENGNPSKEPYTTDLAEGQLQANFEVRLVPERHYTFVAWAGQKSAENLFTLGDPAKNDWTITLSDWTAMNEQRDAFTGIYSTATVGKTFTSSSDITLNLTRPFAKLRVVTTDMEWLNNTNITPAYAEVSYEVELPKTFNAYSEAIGTEVFAQKAHQTFEIKDYTKDAEGKMTLFTDYILVPESRNVKFTLTVYEANEDGTGKGKEIESTSFVTDIFVERNHLTTIEGDILTDGNNITVTVEENFANAENPNDLPYYIEYKEAGSAEALAEIINDLNASTTNEQTHISLTGNIDIDDILNAGTLSTRASEKTYGLQIASGKVVEIDLNGCTISGTDEITKSYALFEVCPGAKFTISDSKGNGKIQLSSTQNRGWNAYSSVISVQRSEFVLNGGTIEHLGGTDMAYGIDVLTNTGAENAKATINGGTIKTPYRAIRQFLNSTKALNELTVNGGEILSTEGNRAIWMQSANTKVNPGKLVVADNAKIGDVMISGAGAPQIAIEASVAKAALQNDSQVILSSVPAGYDVVEKNGNWVVEYGLVENGNEVTVLNAAGLKLFASQVNSGVDYFAGKTVKLGANIDLNNEEWTPIGSATKDHGFMGNFDGNGFVIKNLNITEITLDADGYAYAGLFGVTEGTDKDNQNYIKNLVIENVNIATEGHIAAAAVAYPYYTALKNIKVQGNVNIKGGDYTAGVLAYTRRLVDAENISIEANAGSSIEGNMTVGGVISDIQMNGGLTANYSNFSASGLTIKAVKSVGGISGIICNQTLNGATVKNVNIVCENESKGIVAGSNGGDKSKINNVSHENVTGATRLVGATYNEGAIVVDKANDMVATIKEGKNVYLFNDITIDPAKESSGYGKTGVMVNGQTINGANHTLNVKGANATWDSAIATKGGTIKNLTVSGAFRGIFMPGATADVYIDNVTFSDVVYTFNSDAGNKNYGVYISNSTLNGWTSHSDVHKEVVYTNCKFGEGNGNAFCRPYGPTSFVGCAFEAGFEIDARGQISFENCTIGGVALTAENLATLVTSNIANASVK